MADYYDSFPGRPCETGAVIDNSCGRASLGSKRVGSLSLDLWVKDKQVKRCIRSGECELT